MRAYSQDLRERVLRVLECGKRPTDVSVRFEVSRGWVHEVRRQFREESRRSSLRIGRHRKSLLAPGEPELRKWIAEQPVLTLAEMCERLAQEFGITIKIPALWHQLNKWGLSYKKTLHASEQERPNVQQARLEWKQNQSLLDIEHLVFLDETGTTTSMTRRYGRADGGRRCIAAVLHGRWKTTTFVAGLQRTK
jgi:transposase